VGLIPSLTVSEEYNDNFFYTSDDKKGELTTLITPTLTLRYQNPSVILSANYRGGLRLQIENDDTNQYFQGLTFDMLFPFLSRTFRGVEVNITEVFNHTPDTPPIPLGGTTPSTVVVPVGPVDTSRNAASVSLAYNWSSKLRTNMTYLNTAVQYQGGILEDFMSHNTDIIGTYSVSTITQINLSYGVLTTDFERSDDFTEQRVSVGGSHGITPTFISHGSIGGSLLADRSTLLIATAGFTKKVGRTDSKLDYSRRLTTGEGVVAAAALAQTLSAELVYHPGTRTAVTFGFAHTQTNVLTGSSTQAIAKTNTLTTAVATSFRPWLIGTATYAYFNLHEEGLLNRTLNTNRIIFLLTVADPGWDLFR
jgi:hypothetical protein